MLLALFNVTFRLNRAARPGVGRVLYATSAWEMAAERRVDRAHVPGRDSTTTTPSRR
ncbi:MAG: hypothetical protein MZV49_25125 [Rhodopseudomonas palustris]|nr:hypothetical protein [Rhodopseudomonas palustris]